MTSAASSLVVVDTSVVSLLYRGGELADYYSHQISGRRALVSFQTVEEIWFGANRRGWGDRRKNELKRYLDRYSVVWPTPEMVHICASLRSEREKVGRGLQTADAWIASAAIALRCPLASHDGDFSGIPNLELIRSP